MDDCHHGYITNLTKNGGGQGFTDSSSKQSLWGGGNRLPRSWNPANPAYYLILSVLPLFAWPPALADLCVCIGSEISCFLCNWEPHCVIWTEPNLKGVILRMPNHLNNPSTSVLTEFMSCKAGYNFTIDWSLSLCRHWKIREFQVRDQGIYRSNCKVNIIILFVHFKCIPNFPVSIRHLLMHLCNCSTLINKIVWFRTRRFSEGLWKNVPSFHRVFEKISKTWYQQLAINIHKADHSFSILAHNAVKVTISCIANLKLLKESRTNSTDNELWIYKRT